MVPHSAQQIKVLDDSIADVLPRVNLAGLHRQRLFITGGTGFFGLWLLSALRRLNAAGIAVATRVLSRAPERFLARNPQFRQEAWLEFVTGDVRHFAPPPDEFDLLIHGATETSVTAHAQPDRMLDDIVLGTRQTLQMALKTGVRRVLLLSSGAVYGPQPPGLLRQPDDSMLAGNPWSPQGAYGEGKRVMELLGGMAQRQHGLECLAARCYTFSGPGLPLDSHFAIGNFVRDALYGDAIVVAGDGTPRRSYLHGGDLAVWLLHLLLEGQSGQPYNVGSDEDLSVHELALRVRDVLAPGKEVRVLNHSSEQGFGGRHYVPEITRARALGCAPWTALDESLRSMAEYWKAEGT